MAVQSVRAAPIHSREGRAGSTPGRTRPPSSPPGPVGRSPRGRRPDLLATEALALARQGCSTRIGVRALQQMADREPTLLEAAARRCNRAGDLDHRVRGIALRLLERAASGLRPDPGEPGGPRSRPDRGEGHPP